MSGIVGSKLNIRGSGLVAKLGTDGQVLTSAGAGTQAAFEDVAGGLTWQSVVTGSTLTAVAGNAYWINTTSNTCTITLPASASNGDEILFADYALNWGTNKIIIDSNGLNYQGYDDSYDVEYAVAGTAVRITYSDATKGWIPILDEAVAETPSKGNDNGLFGFGQASAPPPYYNVTNKVSNTGVIATDTSGVGTARGEFPGGCEYGSDTAIFGFGYTGSQTAVTNLVSNTGVVATDTSGVGTARQNLAACNYGGDKGIFGYGYAGSSQSSQTNLVSNTGVVATDTTGVGTARGWLAACEYGDDRGIFGYGTGPLNITNLVSNTGVVGTDVSGVGTAREGLGGASYGGDKGIFAFNGHTSTITNLVSNTGVVATDVSFTGTNRGQVAGCEYGQDKAIFGYGSIPGPAVSNLSNLVSNTGVVATDVSGVGTARKYLAACSYN